MNAREYCPRRLVPSGGEDWMRFGRRVSNALRDIFEERRMRPLPGQLKELEASIEAVFKTSPGAVTVIPLVPGGGKSTLIRALLTVAAEAFCDMRGTVAERPGGIIVVVEKSDEAHELAELCNASAGKLAAVVIESPNDANLGGEAVTMAQPIDMRNAREGAAQTTRSAL